MKKILHTIPFLSSTIQSTYSKSYTLIYDQFNEAIKVPQKWVEDIKHVEFNELLASSIGPLALFFNWKKRHKEEFSEIASGALASSFVHGDPIGTITSIVVLAYRYNQSTNNKNKKILSIGDNLNTDIKGANLLNYDSLIISNGIHKNEIKEKGIDQTAKSYEVICNYIQSEL